MIFLNGLLALAFAAAALPIIVHMLHRRKIQQRDWAAMRFLLDMMATSKRTIFIEQLLLLLLRIFLLVLVVLALTRPAWQPHEALEQITRPAERLSAVVLIDNSFSSAFENNSSRLAAMQEIAETYLDSLREGDEVSILSLGNESVLAADPVYDLAAARAQVAAITPVNQASNIPALMHAAVEQLQRHLNPGAEVLLVTDGFMQGWQADRRAEWQHLQDRLLTNPDAPVGSQGRPRLIVAYPDAANETPETSYNFAVTEVKLAQPVADTRQPVDIIANIHVHGKPPQDTLRIALQVDSEEVDVQEVPVGAHQYFDVVFRRKLTTPGSTLVTAMIQGARDALPADDARTHALLVQNHIPVLFVEGDLMEEDATSPSSKQGLDRSADLSSTLNRQAGALQYASYALAPFDDPEANLHHITRISPTSLAQVDLSAYKMIWLANIAALPADVLAALEGYVVAGGGVVISFGDQSTIEVLNALWSRDGDGLLPMSFANRPERLAQLASDSSASNALSEEAAPTSTLTGDVPEQMPQKINQAMLGHAILASFNDQTREAWRRISVRQWLPVDQSGLPNTTDGQTALQTVLRLNNGDPLLVASERGMGKVVVLTSGLDPHWSDMATRRSFVPLVRGIVNHVVSTVQPPINLQPGDILVYDKSSDRDAVQAQDPLGEAFALEAGDWHGRRVLRSSALEELGGYSVQSGADIQRYAVATAPEESALLGLNPDDVHRIVARLEGVRTVAGISAMAQLFGDQSRQQVELWQWILLATIAALLGESWYTRRLTQQEHGQNTGNSRPGSVAARGSVP
jgi:hypothetical protein